VTSYLAVLTTSHGNKVWNIYYEVRDFIGLPCNNKNDQTRGLIWMSIFNELCFHFHGIDTLDATWENLETMFNKHNEIQDH